MSTMTSATMAAAADAVLQGLPPQWSALLQISGISKNEIARNPQAMVDVLGFFTETTGGGGQVQVHPPPGRAIRSDAVVCLQQPTVQTKYMEDRPRDDKSSPKVNGSKVGGR